MGVGVYYCRTYYKALRVGGGGYSSKKINQDIQTFTTERQAGVPGVPMQDSGATAERTFGGSNRYVFASMSIASETNLRGLSGCGAAFSTHKTWVRGQNPCYTVRSGFEY